MLERILPQIYSLNDYHLIIANGKFPKDPYIVKLIHTAKSIICCDGSVNNLLKLAIPPSYIVGDCDSLAKEIKQYFTNKIIEITKQDTNDLTKAVNFAKTNLGLTNIIILGATGLREDHAIANIGLLTEYAQMIKDIALISEYGIFTAHSGNTQLKTLVGQQISFFTVKSSTLINCNELKWPLVNFQAHLWNQGTLNQAIGNYINLNTTDITIVFRAFEIKP